MNEWKDKLVEGRKKGHEKRTEDKEVSERKERRRKMGIKGTRGE